MGIARQPEPVKLLIGLLVSTPVLLAQAAKRLEAMFGAVDAASPAVPFEHTSYYQAELGDSPWRQFLVFRDLVDPGSLAEIKLTTNALEQEWATDGRRPVNVDPGYISLSKLVLASTKNHWHRIYIGHGFYAEATLPYIKGSFCPQQWTYPDYRTPEHLAFFSAARERYRLQLRSQTCRQPISPT